MAAASRPISLASINAGGIVFTGQCTLRGFWITTSGAATVTLYDNTSGSGLVLASWTLAAAGTQTYDLSDGARCENGIFLVVSAGTVTGNVRVG